MVCFFVTVVIITELVATLVLFSPQLFFSAFCLLQLHAAYHTGPFARIWMHQHGFLLSLYLSSVLIDSQQQQQNNDMEWNDHKAAGMLTPIHSRISNHAL